MINIFIFTKFKLTNGYKIISEIIEENVPGQNLIQPTQNNETKILVIIFICNLYY